MTKNEVIARVREYFSQPGAQLALDDNRACKYRTAEGRACAIGCLIPDTLYDSEWEGGAVITLLENNSNLRAFLLDKDNEVTPQFYGNLQSLHDRTDSPNLTEEENVRVFLRRLDSFEETGDLTAALNTV